MPKKNLAIKIISLFGITEKTLKIPHKSAIINDNFLDVYLSKKLLIIAPQRLPIDNIALKKLYSYVTVPLSVLYIFVN